MCTSLFARRSTMTFSTDFASKSPFAALSVNASSTFFFKGITVPRRKPPSVVAVMADVELAADEPSDERLFPLKHFLPRLEPDQFVLRLLRPEFFRRLDGLVVKLAILRQ